MLVKSKHLLIKYSFNQILIYKSNQNLKWQWIIFQINSQKISLRILKLQHQNLSPCPRKKKLTRIRKKLSLIRNKYLTPPLITQMRLKRKKKKKVIPRRVFMKSLEWNLPQKKLINNRPNQKEKVKTGKQQIIKIYSQHKLGLNHKVI